MTFKEFLEKLRVEFRKGFPEKPPRFRSATDNAPPPDPNVYYARRPGPPGTPMTASWDEDERDKKGR